MAVFLRSIFSKMFEGSGGKSTLSMSVVVVSYNMKREIPRTIQSLSTAYQRKIARNEYELLLVDNGSDTPWAAHDFDGIDTNLEIMNVPEANPSPARAVNLGLRSARAPLVGVLVDGARLVTPGLLDACRRASLLYPRAVIATVGFHLGFEHQSQSVKKGYTRAVEDRLLSSISWHRDGYRLFDISVLNHACAGGWFHPMSECNALFMPAAMWTELGGYDEAFRCPGGGLVNLDTYERALALPGAQSVVVLGEGNFHQVHGGVSSNSTVDRWPEFHEEYRRIRNRDYCVPAASSVFFGAMPEAALRHFPRGPDAVDGRLDLLNQALLNETALETCGD
jgi:glycosyltransferase involved in cell wall biosynthesis